MGKVWSGAPGRRDGQGPGRSDTCSSGLSPGFPRAEVSSQECVRSEGSVCSGICRGCSVEPRLSEVSGAGMRQGGCSKFLREA